MPSSPIRTECTFHGLVQGVGFRWTASTIAESEGVSGWVRNAPDGTVVMLVEGSPEATRRVLEGLEARLPGHITHLEALETPASGEFSGFRILRG